MTYSEISKYHFFQSKISDTEDDQDEGICFMMRSSLFDCFSQNWFRERKMR